MKSFLKYVLATITGIVIATVILFIVIAGIIGSLISSASTDAAPVVADNSVLYITLNHEIKERSETNPLEGVDIPGLGTTKTLGLDDILERIQSAKTDSKIKGIYLNISGVNTGFATLQEIRDALIDFKASKKFIVSYSEGYTQKAYYLASVADKIYLNPEGSLDFRGLSTSIMFMKDALDKLGVDMQVVKVGTYKSAVEPFMLNGMSQPNRLQVESYLGSLYTTFLDNVSASRKIPVDSLRSIADRYAVRDAEDAVSLKLVDAVLYKDELIEEVKKRLNIKDKKKDFSTVSILDYRANSSTSEGEGRVAVLYAEGDIVSGEGESGQIASDKVSRELRKLREDDRVKAVVFRVNSPGGSALASDVIWREVVLTKKVKPIVVSMGDYAASGGYYISAAADSIFAEKNTITGSIGVFGLIPNFKGLLNDKLGIHFDGVKTGTYADLMSAPDRPLTAEERNIIQLEVNKTYGSFTKKVAEGRKLSVANVDSIGQGRVWTGEQAVGIGLVDRIGSIRDAVRSAAKMAKLKDYKVVKYPSLKDPFSSILSTSKEKISVWYMKDQLGDQYRYIQELKSVTQQSGIMAKLPYSIEVH
ncbi:signal peptide peptidase SppA [Sphingobacterium spiritivorum]|uniref:signal peptide peptidase SppA n=1 Tax=Sphingobacterium spiritivorum TaxID=258 RepID=UPI00191B17DE|nr:signal peptide peptidase SppA [Sphingobacterium spiritivorum]QQT24545.1 signal peptide peptidase SppA [Sphingobacterium spiritivorum]